MKQLTTTLRKVLTFNPCSSALNKIKAACKDLGITWEAALDIPVTPLDILGTVGIKDAMWALRAFAYKDYCLLLADIAEGVWEHTKGTLAERPVWEAIQAVHYWKAGLVDDQFLKEAAWAADDAAAWADDAAAWAAYAAADAAANADAAAYAAADAAAYAAADAAANADADAAAWAAYAADAAADADADADAAAWAAYAADAAWDRTKDLFIQHFEQYGRNL